MQALRQFHKVENGQLTIQLPIDFSGKEVEVIILQKAAGESHDEVGPNETDLFQAAIQNFLAMDTSHLTADQRKAYKRSCTLIQQEYDQNRPRIFGLYAGLGSISDDFDSLSEEELAIFEADNIFPTSEPTH